MGDFSTTLNDLVRAQIRAVDNSAVNHWYVTGHRVQRAQVPAGWACPECDASFTIKFQAEGIEL